MKHEEGVRAIQHRVAPLGEVQDGDAVQRLMEAVEDSREGQRNGGLGLQATGTDQAE